VRPNAKRLRLKWQCIANVPKANQSTVRNASAVPRSVRGLIRSKIMCDQQCADQHNAEIDDTGLIVCEGCPIEMPDKE